MKTYTVRQVGKLAGVSVRALHHYDEIGLLKPAFLGENRYRYYTRDELLRLQQILFHRELGIPLQEIAGLIAGEGSDRVAALKAQRARLETEVKRHRRLIRTIDRTIAELKGERVMKDTELYQGFSPEKQAAYEDWLVDRYGGGMRGDIVESHKRLAAFSDKKRNDWMAELQVVERGLADAMLAATPPESPRLDPLLTRHRSWVGQAWGKSPDGEAYAGLADLYLAHPDFRARYETIEPGFAEWLAAAMKSFAAREPG